MDNVTISYNITDFLSCVSIVYVCVFVCSGSHWQMHRIAQSSVDVLVYLWDPLGKGTKLHVLSDVDGAMICA